MIIQLFPAYCARFTYWFISLKLENLSLIRCQRNMLNKAHAINYASVHISECLTSDDNPLNQNSNVVHVLCRQMFALQFGIQSPSRKTKQITTPVQFRHTTLQAQQTKQQTQAYVDLPWNNNKRATPN